jgi:hypothetical protein
MNICKICNKTYKSYQTLWIHNNSFHPNNYISDKIRNYQCEKCDKKFTRKNNMVLHMKTKCKKINELTEKDKLKKELIELKKENEKLKESKSTTTINGNINGNINNGTINNIIYINKPGDENILKLNKSEINDILNKGVSGVVTYVEKINFNERLPSNHSFCSTNLDSAYLSVYDIDKSKVTKDRKKYFFEEVISKSVSKMEELYKINKIHFKPERQKHIEETLISLNDLKNMDMSKKILKEMIKKLNILSYNENDIVKNTWLKKDDNGNSIIKGKNYIPQTLDEDLEMETESSDSDSDIENNILKKNKR